MMDAVLNTQKWPTTGSVLLVRQSVSVLKPDSETIARSYAKKVLCENGSRNLPLFDSNNHPDFRYIRPTSDSQWIKIDQIRELVSWAVGKPQIACKQVAIIDPAHAMNLQAANALLKTLEEPTENTLFILVTDKPSAIPATIRSRCHWIRLRSAVGSGASLVTEQSELKTKLTRELQALQNNTSDPVAVAGHWIKDKQDPKELLDCVLVLLNEQLVASVRTGHGIQKRQWWRFFENVLEARRQLEEPNQPNIQLLMEALLIQLHLNSACLL